MSAQVTSFRSKDADEVELTNITTAPTNGSRPNSAGGDKHEIDMRKQAVHPIPEGENEGGKERDSKAHADDADGNDPLDPDSLAPLLTTNQYSVRKMAAQAMIDVALMMANISQLRTLITAGPSNMEYYYLLVVLVSLSIASQIVFAILIFIIWMKESDFQQREEYLNALRQVVDAKSSTTASSTTSSSTPTKTEQIRWSMIKREEAFREHRLTNHLNYISMVIVFIITVINMFITGFGIKLDAIVEVPRAPTNSS